MSNHLAIATQMIAHYNAQDAINTPVYPELVEGLPFSSSLMRGLKNQGGPSTSSGKSGFGESGLCSRVEFIR